MLTDRRERTWSGARRATTIGRGCPPHPIRADDRPNCVDDSIRTIEMNVVATAGDDLNRAVPDSSCQVALQVQPGFIHTVVPFARSSSRTAATARRPERRSSGAPIRAARHCAAAIPALRRACGSPCARVSRRSRTTIGFQIHGRLCVLAEQHRGIHRTVETPNRRSLRLTSREDNPAMLQVESGPIGIRDETLGKLRIEIRDRVGGTG